MIRADALLEPTAGIPLPAEQKDRGASVVSGSVEDDGRVFEAGQMMVFHPGDRVSLKTGERGARLMMPGGETFDGSRHTWRNFVTSSNETFEEAGAAWHVGDWEHGRFRLPPDDTDDCIPLLGR